jgi:hypothetical protein
MMFLNSAGRLAIGNFSGAAEKIHVRGTDDQRIRVESTDGPASLDLYSIGQDYRMVNASGQLQLQRSGNSFGAVDNIFDVRDDGTFRFRQNVDMDDLRIVNVADPEGPQQVVNLRTMEGYVADFVDEQLNQQSLFPEELSSQVNNVTFGACAFRCRTLTEGGHSNWGLPSLDQLSQFTNGPVTSSSFTWTSSGAFGQDRAGYYEPLIEAPAFVGGSQYGHFTMRLTTGQVQIAEYDDNTVSCRCVR